MVDEREEVWKVEVEAVPQSGSEHLRFVAACL